MASLRRFVQSIRERLLPRPSTAEVIDGRVPTPKAAATKKVKTSDVLLPKREKALERKTYCKRTEKLSEQTDRSKPYEVPPQPLAIRSKKTDKAYEMPERTVEKRPRYEKTLILKRYSTQPSTQVLPMVTDRKLFTPGPLLVTSRVKKAMMIDVATRHADFAYITQFVRHSILQIAKVSEDDFTAIPLNGSGTFATEATLRSMLGSNNKKLVVLNNGMYGDRIALICHTSGIKVTVIPMNLKTLKDTLMGDREIAGVIAVHCETSSGLINPVKEIGEVVKNHSKNIMFLVDAMTSFGAVPLEMKNVDFMMSNSCRSLQGVPGVSFVVARKDMLEKHRSRGTGMVLDIGAQYDELEKSGQFRFTPPSHVMMAFKEALMEYADEGGLEGRAKRYKTNSEILKEEMADMGFQQLFSDEKNPEGYLLTAFRNPNNPLFIFEEFYNRLGDTGNIISSNKTTVPNCFRIGNIGDLSKDDMKDLVFSIRHVCNDMRLSLPLRDPQF